MNGQAGRLEIVRSIIEMCHVEQIVETGTYRGTTTEWFSQFSVPVFSAEIHPRFASFSRRRLASKHNVHIENIDSAAALERWSDVSEIASRRTLFYLDAHWQETLPLNNELEIINRKFNSWIAIIDDFKVPGDETYEFDACYGPGQVLDMELIYRCMPDAIAFFPTIRGKLETGAKRGCVVLAGDHESAAKCRESPLLRQTDSGSGR